MMTTKDFIMKNRKTLNFGDEYPEFTIRKLSPFDLSEFGVFAGYISKLSEREDKKIIEDEIVKSVSFDEIVENIDFTKKIIMYSVVKPRIVEKFDDVKDDETLCILDIDAVLYEKLLDSILEFSALKGEETKKIEPFREKQDNIAVD